MADFDFTIKVSHILICIYILNCKQMDKGTDLKTDLQTLIKRHTSGVIAVKSVFAEDKNFTVPTDQSAGATVTCRAHYHLSLNANHLLRLHGFHLSAGLRWKTAPAYNQMTLLYSESCKYLVRWWANNLQSRYVISHPNQLRLVRCSEYWQMLGCILEHCTMPCTRGLIILQCKLVFCWGLRK